MNTTKACPVCEEGVLQSLIGKNTVEYRGQQAEIDSLYSTCDACCSDIATPEQTHANKRLMIAFKKRVDGY